MKNLTCIIGIVGLLWITASCSLKDPAISEARISTDKTSVEVEAEIAADTLKITSTRSWTAKIKTSDGGNWLSVSEKEHINAGGVLETSEIVLSFARYKGANERTASLSIYCAEYGKELVIPVVQKAYSPKISIEALDNPVGISAKGADCYVTVRSNTSWKASIVKEESTVVPSLSVVEGNDTQTIRLEFPANGDDELAKFAKLCVKADGCEDATLEFVQTQSERFFFLSEAVASEIVPYESSIYIPLRSNGPWTATLSECTFENGRVEPSEGLYAYSGIYFNYSLHGEDPLAEKKHALITIHRDGMEDIKVEFTQKGSIHINFGHYNPDYEWAGAQSDEEYKPYTTVTKVFSEPTSFPYTYASGTFGGVETDCITSAGSFVFKMYGSDCGLYYVPGSYCFCIGKKKGDYVIFPSFEGYRLSEMYYEASCRNMTPYTIRDGSGQIIQGGELTNTVKTVPISCEYNDMHHHIFPQTAPGASYRMVLEETLRVISIKDLCLVYEKYE